ncbi:MAG TPA: hypothetical protein VFE19_02665 [Jatrophihabitantaceae bacterium]|jgi:hypothetical protein|nr:hypothetical protein [Jatrophihabitantaceae bacterium]
MRGGSDEVKALPPDAILVHIGMHKTGTTTMQSLFGAKRSELGQFGITYPGKVDSHHTAANSLVGRPIARSASGPVPPDIRRWQRVVHEARASAGRVVVSSEFLSHATDEQAQQLVADLGSDRVHVIVGIRNLAPLALSAWQQDLKLGKTKDVDRWLTDFLRREDGAGKQGRFWTLHDPIAAVPRWARAAGPGGLTVLVIDEADRTLLPRTFEQLLELPPGMLSDSRARMSNRSMTAAEAEMVRQVNVGVRHKISSLEYVALMRYGAIRRLVETRASTAGEARIEVPAWVVEIAAEEGRKLAAATLESGARIVGSLDSLTAAPAGDGTGQPRAVDAVPLRAAVEAIVGAIGGATGRSWSLDKSPRGDGGGSGLPARFRPSAPGPATARRPPAKPRRVALSLDTVPTRSLVKALGARVKAAVRRRVRSLVHR